MNLTLKGVLPLLGDDETGQSGLSRERVFGLAYNLPFQHSIDVPKATASHQQGNSQIRKKQFPTELHYSSSSL